MVICIAEMFDTNTDVLYGNGQGNVSFVKWFKVMGQTWQADLARDFFLFYFFLFPSFSAYSLLL
jgi:hypothetical protein